MIEDDIRLKEKAQRFDEDFVRLARSVYFENDERARIKKDINVALGSATADGRVVCRTVANCSTTILESDSESLVLVEPPAEVPRTEVL